jgi:hypothetical protein
MRGAWHWTWAEARRLRGEFWLAGIVFALVTVVGGIALNVRLTTNASVGEKLVAALEGLGLGVAAVLLVGLVVGLVVTPFQQRNALRVDLLGEREAFRATYSETERRRDPAYVRHLEYQRDTAGEALDYVQGRRFAQSGMAIPLSNVKMSQLRLHFAAAAAAIDAWNNAMKAYTTTGTRPIAAWPD